MHSWPPLKLVALLKTILWQIKHGSPTFKKMGCFNILALFCSLFGQRKKRKRHKTKKEEEMWEEGKEGDGIRKHGCATQNNWVTFFLFHVKIILFLPPQNKSSCKLPRPQFLPFVWDCCACLTIYDTPDSYLLQNRLYCPWHCYLGFLSPLCLFL